MQHPCRDTLTLQLTELTEIVVGKQPPAGLTFTWGSEKTAFSQRATHWDIMAFAPGDGKGESPRVLVRSPVYIIMDALYALLRQGSPLTGNYLPHLPLSSYQATYFDWATGAQQAEWKAAMIRLAHLLHAKDGALRRFCQQQDDLWRAAPQHGTNFIDSFPFVSIRALTVTPKEDAKAYARLGDWRQAGWQPWLEPEMLPRDAGEGGASSAGGVRLLTDRMHGLVEQVVLMQQMIQARV